MFSEEMFAKLKESGFYRKFATYCFLGGLSFFVMGAALIVLGFLMKQTVASCILIVCGAAFLAVPGGFLFRASKKPYLCSAGVIESKEKGRAVIDVDGTKVSGTSFERFLKCAPLDAYGVGDEVIVYAADKRMTRALFCHK